MIDTLHVNVAYLPLVGGAQFHIHEIARRQIREGDRVTVYTTNAIEIEYLWRLHKGDGKTACLEETMDQVHVRRFPVQHLPLMPYSYAAVRRLMAELSTLPVDFSPLLFRLSQLTPWVPSLDKYLAHLDHRFALVHAWNIPYEGLIAAASRYAARQQVPFVVTPLLHLGESARATIRRYYTMRHQMALLQRANAVIVLTEIERDFLLSHGVMAERLFVVGAGANPDEVTGGDPAQVQERYALSRPYVLFLGMVNRDKGAIDTVEAMRRLWDAGVEADLVVAGEVQAAFADYWQRTGSAVASHCHLLGTVSTEEKRNLLAGTSLLVLPSHSDSFGQVFVEAWMNGKPVIGARAGGIPGVIDEGKDGLLVPYGDPVALAGAIRSLLDDSARAAAMGERGRAKALARFTWEQVYRDTRAVYEAVLS
ncbi:MAG: glycosyltransferase family 4 protein [Chloroflexi bacterium]|nr:glycosyltransferase family 4 protein [Chloroflexota bacterium]